MGHSPPPPTPCTYYIIAPCILVWVEEGRHSKLPSVDDHPLLEIHFVCLAERESLIWFCCPPPTSGCSAPPACPAEQPATVTVKRSESTKDPKFVEQLERQIGERSKSERRPKPREELREGKPSSPSKSDTMKSTDSASGGETLEDRSSKEGSPTKELPSPTKEKKKKKKFRIPSFSKKKSKENKESAI